MSKISKPYDRWRQLMSSQYEDVCPGCGWHYSVYAAHRSDCTADDDARARIKLRRGSTQDADSVL